LPEAPLPQDDAGGGFDTLEGESAYRVGHRCLLLLILVLLLSLGGGPIPVTLSLGLSSVEQGKNQPLDCETFLHATEALYAAKARGRNRVESAPALRAAAAGHAD
jgi:GGDEF domain-containing protein